MRDTMPELDEAPFCRTILAEARGALPSVGVLNASSGFFFCPDNVPGTALPGPMRAFPRLFLQPRPPAGQKSDRSFFSPLPARQQMSRLSGRRYGAARSAPKSPTGLFTSSSTRSPASCGRHAVHTSSISGPARRQSSPPCVFSAEGDASEEAASLTPRTEKNGLTVRLPLPQKVRGSSAGPDLLRGFGDARREYPPPSPPWARQFPQASPAQYPAPR